MVDENSQDKQKYLNKELLYILMMRKNRYSMNILELACYQITEFQEDQYLVVVLQEMPFINNYLSKPDDQGQLPIFKVASFFSNQELDEDSVQSTVQSVAQF